LPPNPRRTPSQICPDLICDRHNGHIAAAARSAPQHQHALGKTSKRIEKRSGSRLAQRISLRDYHGYRSIDLPSGPRAGAIKRLRIRPSDNGNAVGARSQRCAANNNRCALARADAAGARSAHIRRLREGSDGRCLDHIGEHNIPACRCSSHKSIILFGDLANLTDLEAAALGVTIVRTHIINSGQSPPSRKPPAEAVPARPARAMLGPSASVSHWALLYDSANMPKT